MNEGTFHHMLSSEKIINKKKIIKINNFLYVLYK